jgi:hypothetical protein
MRTSERPAAHRAVAHRAPAPGGKRHNAPGNKVKALAASPIRQNGAAARKAPDRQQRGQRGKPDEEGHGMSNRDPVGKVERLDIGREHLKPRPVIPKREFHGLEVRAVHKTAGVPGDVGEGRIQAVATGVALLLPQVHTGKIKLLMVNNRQRSPQVPEVPTATEAGYPELTFEGAVGLYGWRDMPIDLKERIAADVRTVAIDPVIATRVANMGSALRIGTPTEFAAAIEEQRAKIAAIAKGMKPTQ